jgi:hypothetical protein
MILYYFLGDLIHDIMIDEHEHQHTLLLDIHNIYAEELRYVKIASNANL